MTLVMSVWVSGVLSLVVQSANNLGFLEFYFVYNYIIQLHDYMWKKLNKILEKILHKLELLSSIPFNHY